MCFLSGGWATRPCSKASSARVWFLALLGGEESLGEKYMGEKYVQEESLGEKYVQEEFLGEESG